MMLRDFGLPTSSAITLEEEGGGEEEGGEEEGGR